MKPARRSILPALLLVAAGLPPLASADEENLSRIKEQELEDVREKIGVELSERTLDELRREWVRNLRKKAEIKVNDRVLESLE